ncbi:hypothetical protein WMY93_014412 [Mugilogobius chulae]|uniref:Uncharacterized protein n=1 Tax=Mugilogobius chulae TaxID=88201 RepID=A0AAW0NZ49_9GOBI
MWGMGCPVGDTALVMAENPVDHLHYFLSNELRCVRLPVAHVPSVNRSFLQHAVCVRQTALLEVADTGVERPGRLQQVIGRQMEQKAGVWENGAGKLWVGGAQDWPDLFSPVPEQRDPQPIIDLSGPTLHHGLLSLSLSPLYRDAGVRTLGLLSVTELSCKPTAASQRADGGRGQRVKAPSENHSSKWNPFRRSPGILHFLVG